MKFRDVVEICEEFVDNNPNLTMKDVCEIFIRQREDLGLPYADLGKLLYHLGYPELMPEESKQALREEGLIK